MRYLDEAGLVLNQEGAEFQAWEIIKLLEETR